MGATTLPDGEYLSNQSASKSIAIVGAGVSGLTMLKTLLDLLEQQRNTWEIVVFEQRANIGGIWLPDPFPKAPPVVPETPLYPLLHTNTPVPFLAYPGLPFPKGTALFPSHEHVLAYFTRYSERFNLLPYIRFNHTILSASWHGSPLQGTWNVTYSDQHNAIHSKAFHHLIDATGVSQIPRIPHWRGEAEWLANKMHQRELVHSMWYRNPEKYSGRSVLIVGEGPSARDIASQLASVVQKLYVSIRGNVNANYDFYGPFPSNAILKPGISHFTEQSIVFVDNTHIGVDTVLLATGYELRKPFLDAGGVLTTDSTANSNQSYPERLVSNTYYIFPLYKHIFSLSALHPPTALSFLGLVPKTDHPHTGMAQSLIIAHSIRDPSILPSYKQMLHDLAIQEQELRDEGVDPYTCGHLMVDGKRTCDYQDDLLDYLRDKGAVKDDDQKFVEEWRRKIFAYCCTGRGWKRIEALGVGEEWARNVETEEEWTELMDRVNSWQEDYENINQGV